MQAITARRSSAKPRWGWPGHRGFIRPPREKHGRIRQIVGNFPQTRSEPEQLVENFLWLGGRYRRALAQDEFGPTRAERLAVA